jgi:hypothetical protein
MLPLPSSIQWLMGKRCPSLTSDGFRTEFKRCVRDDMEYDDTGMKLSLTKQWVKCFLRSTQTSDVVQAVYYLQDAGWETVDAVRNHQIDITPTPMAVVVQCVDHRFQHGFQNVLKEHNIENYDLISIPGGGGNSEGVLPLIHQCVELHNPAIIVVISHEDCGGGTTRTSHDQAVCIIKQTFPAMKIIDVFVSLVSLQ